MIEWALVLLGTALGMAVLFRPSLLGVSGNSEVSDSSGTSGNLRSSGPSENLGSSGVSRSGTGTALLGFFFLAVGMTAPLLLHPERMMLDSGAPTDAFIGVWNLWWTSEAVTSGHNPYFTNMLFAPVGTDLSLHTHSVTYGILTLPILVVFGAGGPPGIFGVYNLILLLSFTLCAYFTYRLALTLTSHAGASVLAGILFAFSNFRFANTVRLHVLSMEWFVLFVWMWILSFRNPSPSRLVGLALSGVLLINASLELTAYAAVLVVLWTVVELGGRYIPGSGPRDRAAATLKARTLALGTLGAGAVAVLGIAPLAVRLLPRLGDRPAFEPRVAAHFSADLLDFILPNPRHPLWGDTFASITARFHLGDDGFGQSLGLVALALFLFGGVQLFRAREGRRWWLGAVACIALALGPVLHVAGQEVGGLPMPQKILSQLVPILGQSRTPIRWIAPASLCLALSVAWGWALFRRSGDRIDRITIGAALLLVLSSLSAPLEFTEEPIPAIYGEIAEVSRATGVERAGLLHLPGMLPREALLFQTVHGQRLVEDVSAAVPLHDSDLATLTDPRYAMFVRELARPGALATLGADGTARASADLRAYLAANQIRWIVVASDPGLHAWALGSLFPSSVHGDPIYSAYLGNLRLLSPLDEISLEGFTAFRF